MQKFKLFFGIILFGLVIPTEASAIETDSNPKLKSQCDSKPDFQATVALQPPSVRFSNASQGVSAPLVSVTDQKGSSVPVLRLESDFSKESLGRLWGTSKAEFFDKVYYILDQELIKPIELRTILMELKVPFKPDYWDREDKKLDLFTRIKEKITNEWDKCSDKDQAQHLFNVTFRAAELFEDPSYRNMVVTSTIWKGFEKTFLGDDDAAKLINFFMGQREFTEVAYFINKMSPKNRDVLKARFMAKVISAEICRPDRINDETLANWVERLNKVDFLRIEPGFEAAYVDLLKDDNIISTFIGAVHEHLQLDRISPHQALGLLTSSGMSLIKGAFPDRYDLYRLIEDRLIGDGRLIPRGTAAAIREVFCYVNDSFERYNEANPVMRLCHMYVLEESAPPRAQLQRIASHPKADEWDKEKARRALTNYFGR